MDSPLPLDPASVVFDKKGYSSDHNYMYLSPQFQMSHTVQFITDSKVGLLYMIKQRNSNILPLQKSQRLFHTL
jgi:hypothetical protein